MIFERRGRMTFGPSKRHEATRYVTRGGGWKKHGNRISSHPLVPPAGGGRRVVPSFRRRNSVPGFVRLVVLTASLIKSLRPGIVSFFAKLRPRLSVFPSRPLPFLLPARVIRATSATSPRGNYGVAFGKASLTFPQIIRAPTLPLFIRNQ